MKFGFLEEGREGEIKKAHREKYKEREHCQEILKLMREKFKLSKFLDQLQSLESNIIISLLVWSGLSWIEECLRHVVGVIHLKKERISIL